MLGTSWIRSTQATTCCPSSDNENGENLTGFDPVRPLAEPDDAILVHADVTSDLAPFRVAEVILSRRRTNDSITEPKISRTRNGTPK